jgi:hypothetical protein
VPQTPDIFDTFPMLFAKVARGKLDELRTATTRYGVAQQGYNSFLLPCKNAVRTQLCGPRILRMNHGRDARAT